MAAEVTLPEISDPSAMVEVVKMATGNQNCLEEAAADSPARVEDFLGEVDKEEVHRSAVEAAGYDRELENHDSMPIQIRRESWVFVRCYCEPGLC